jgi:integrase/recombinase XerD
VHSSVLIADRRRSYVTEPGYRLGVPPANAGKKYPAEVLSREEIHRLLGAMGRGNAGARNRALVVVMWRCGLRVAEALALEPKDIDLASCALQVLHGKGNYRRVVGVDQEAIAALELWYIRRRTLRVGPGRPVFCVISRPTLGKPLYSAYVREMLKDAATRAGIERRVHPHGLRHTFAVELARDGVPVHQIRKALGHQSLATTERYIDHLEPLEVVRMMQARAWGPLSHGPSELGADGAPLGAAA